MYNIIYETNCQSRFDARYWMLGAGALGWLGGMVWGGRREEGSGWGTRVCLWWIHFDIWQNQYNIVKFKNKIKLKKIKCAHFSYIVQWILTNIYNHGTPLWYKTKCRLFPSRPTKVSLCLFAGSLLCPGTGKLLIFFPLICALIFWCLNYFSLPRSLASLSFRFFSCIMLLLFSRSVMSNSLWPHGLQHTRFPVFHYLLEFAHTHVHWVDDAIQPSYPLSPLSLPVFNLSQHQGLFQWVGSSHQVAKVLEVQLQHQSFQWIFRVDFL